MIPIMAMIESISVGKTLGAKKNEKKGKTLTKNSSV